MKPKNQKIRERSEKIRKNLALFFIKCSPKIKHLRGHFFVVSVPDGCALVPGPISAAKVNRGGFPIKNVSRRGDHILFGKGYYLCHGRCVRFLHTMKSSFFLFLSRTQYYTILKTPKPYARTALGKSQPTTMCFGIYPMELASRRRNFERQGKASAKADGVVTYVEGDKPML